MGALDEYDSNEVPSKVAAAGVNDSIETFQQLSKKPIIKNGWLIFNDGKELVCSVRANHDNSIQYERASQEGKEPVSAQ